ncbi:5'-3' exonuclease H3TH domain-containing protein, partial [Planctomycetota bacterium]
MELVIRITINIPVWLEWICVQPLLLIRWLRYGYTFRRIPLTQGKFAIIDPDDYNRLSKHKWYAVKNDRAFYVARAVKNKEGKQHQISMHRCVIKVPDNIRVDHINHNGLDNRKKNLRPATSTQNARNRAKYNNRIFSSKYKGVTWHKGHKKWQAQIRVNSRPIFLGSFKDELLAAKEYDRAAGKYFEEFAVLNFPIPELSLCCRLLSYLCAALKSILVLPARLAAVNFLYRRPCLAVPTTAMHSPIYARSGNTSLPSHAERKPGASFRTFEIGSSKLPAPHEIGHCRNLVRRFRISDFDIRICCPLPLTSRPAIRKVMTMPKKLYIIDGHAHIYAAFYAPIRQQFTSPAGEPTKATYIFTTAIMGLIQRQKPDMLVVAMDSKAPTFRHELYSEYKATRPPMPDDMPQQINRIEQILDAMRIPIFRLDGYEADDLIGTIAARASADGYDCLLCSKDKDLLQLLDEHVSTCDIKTGEVTDVAAMKRKMDLTPAQFVDALALQGDTSDNVPGVPDVGPKTALTWIQKYGSIENLYEHIDEIKGKRGDNLRKFKDKLELSKTLVTIDCNVPIEIDYNDLALKDFNDAVLAEIFNELGFNRLLAQLNLKAAEDIKSAEVTDAVKQKDLDKPDSIITTPHDYQLIDTPQKLDKFTAELNKQKLFAVDTETTALDPMRAELVGISFSWLPHKAFYLPVKAPLGAQRLELSAVRKKLASILADESVKKIGQNIKYDILVLKNANMPLKGVCFDTMVASYCLDAQRRRHSMDSMAADFLNVFVEVFY